MEEIVKSFFILILFINQFFSEVAANGKRLCDVRAFTPKSSIKNCTKQKKFSAD